MSDTDADVAADPSLCILKSTGFFLMYFICLFLCVMCVFDYVILLIVQAYLPLNGIEYLFGCVRALYIFNIPIVHVYLMYVPYRTVSPTHVS